MKHFIIVLIIFISFSSFAHDLSKTSYYSIIMNKTSGNYDSQLSENCKKSLRNYFRLGNSLYMEEFERHKTLVKEYNYRSQRLDSLFYHYTDSWKAWWNVKINNIDSFFYYRRIKRKTGLTNLYVAEDPFSSSGYGEIQIRIKIAPKATITGMSATRIQPFIDKKVPKLSHCWGNLRMTDRENPYYNLILEENGVDLLAFTGFQEWFQIIKASNITDITIGTKDEW